MKGWSEAVPKCGLPDHPARSGFSLLEVLVALTILSMAFAVLFSLSSRSLDGMRRARDVERRIEFARNKLAELQLVSELRAGDSATGALEDGTRWRVDVMPFIEPALQGPLVNPNSVLRIRMQMEWMGRVDLQTWAVESYRLVRPQPPSLPVSLEDQLRALSPR